MSPSAATTSGSGASTPVGDEALAAARGGLGCGSTPALAGAGLMESSEGFAEVVTAEVFFTDGIGADWTSDGVASGLAAGFGVGLIAAPARSRGAAASGIGGGWSSPPGRTGAGALTPAFTAGGSAAAGAARREATGDIPDCACFGVFSDRKSTRLNSSHLGISYAVF